MWLSGPSHTPANPGNTQLGFAWEGAGSVRGALRLSHAISALRSDLPENREWGVQRCGICSPRSSLRALFSARLRRPRSAFSSSPTMPTAMASTAAWRPARPAGWWWRPPIASRATSSRRLVPQDRPRRDHRGGADDQWHQRPRRIRRHRVPAIRAGSSRRPAPALARRCAATDLRPMFRSACERLAVGPEPNRSTLRGAVDDELRSSP